VCVEVECAGFSVAFAVAIAVVVVVVAVGRVMLICVHGSALLPTDCPTNRPTDRLPARYHDYKRLR